MKIINPLNGKKYSIFDKIGRSILKKYIRVYKNGGSDAFPKQDKYLLQHDFSLEKFTHFFVGLNCHSADCISNVLVSIGILNRSDGINLATSSLYVDSGISLENMCDALNKHPTAFLDVRLYPKHLKRTPNKYPSIARTQMVEPLLSEEPEFLKIYSYLKFDNCCLFAYRYLFDKYGHGVILLKLKNSAYLFEIYKLFMILIHGQAKFGIFYPKVTADVFPIELDRSVMSFEKWGESMFFGKESIPCILDPQDGSIIIGFDSIRRMFRKLMVTQFSIILTQSIDTEMEDFST